METIVMTTALLMSNTPLTYYAAKNACTENDTMLAPLEMITSYLNDAENKEPVWLPLVKKKYKEWSWLNGIKHEALSDPATDNRDQECAVYRSEDHVLDDEVCSQTDHFICELQDTDTWPNFNPKDFIHIYKGKSSQFYLIKEKYTWYEAQTFCSTNNMQLATFTPNVHEVMQSLQSKLSRLREHGHFWIGLTRMAWFLESSDEYSIDSMVVSRFAWIPGGPAPGHECASSKWTQDGLAWKGEYCSNAYRALCYTGDFHAKEEL